jgi:hypothetical protein
MIHLDPKAAWASAAFAFLTLSAAGQAVPTAPAAYPELPSEMPVKLVPATTSFDYERHEAMIPMRDGVRLYDRNPQSFVPSIFWAKPADYKTATQRIYHAPEEASSIELPVMAAE